MNLYVEMAIDILFRIPLIVYVPNRRGLFDFAQIFTEFKRMAAKCSIRSRSRLVKGQGHSVT